MTCQIELLVIELFDHLTVCINKMCLQIIYNQYIRGAFNTFPDFFVQAFKIVVDS